MFETTFDYFFWLYLVPAGICACVFSITENWLRSLLFSSLRQKEGNAFDEKLASKCLVVAFLLLSLLPGVNLVTAISWIISGTLYVSVYAVTSVVTTYKFWRRR